MTAPDASSAGPAIDDEASTSRLMRDRDGRWATLATAATLSGETDAPARGDDLVHGEILDGRYRILRTLGVGGMGTVYLAEHVGLGRQLAVKVLCAPLQRRDDAVQRFYREARAASLIAHENIVSVLDLGRSPSGQSYFVMEYLDGKDLRHHLRAHGPFSVARVRHIGIQVCRALEATHARGIIHRDLKPDNIVLLSPQTECAPLPGLFAAPSVDVVKLLDFGVAKMLGAVEQDITAGGAIFGTPAYMAPEQVSGGDVDHRADLYSLGCVLYEMISGSVPFASGTVAGVLTKQLFDVPEPLGRRAPDRHVPPELDQAILRALSKNRDRRFANARAMAEALAAIGVDRRRPTPIVENASRLEASLLQCWLELLRGDPARALARAEAVIEAVGGIGSDRLLPYAELLERFYGRLAGPLGRTVSVGRVPPTLDPRSAFLLSRIDVPLTVDELCDVSAMPRFEALRLVIQLLRAGALEVA